MAKRKVTLADLRTQLVYAQVREHDNDFMVRMDAREQVKKLQARIKRAEKKTLAENPIKWPGYSKDAVKNNIRALIDEGRTQKQAIAIAIHYARQAYRHKYPTRAWPHWLKPMVRSNPTRKEFNDSFISSGFKYVKTGHRAGQIETVKCTKCGAELMDTGAAKAAHFRVCPVKNPLPGEQESPSVPRSSPRWGEVFRQLEAMKVGAVTVIEPENKTVHKTGTDWFFVEGTKNKRLGAWRAADAIVKSRLKNPIGVTSQKEAAAKLFQKFTGHKGATVKTVQIPDPPKAVACIGKIDGILYTTVREGRTERYRHTFKKSARPLFCVSHDGRQIVLIGGSYDFTERGIVDRSK